ncbi:MAG TPA: ABC transporter ATP-binding protein/permease [Alphaproteobacteria bacterium]|nr:ABC transporter ATP-binding protein/permease [Alphaproteobacteria bacterium]
MTDKRPNMVVAAFRMAKPYFTQSNERGMAWTLLILVILLNLALVAFSVAFTYWYRDFYNALQNKDWDAFVYNLGYFGVLAFAQIATFLTEFYVNRMLYIRWRTWLTDRYLQRWLENQSYYRLQHGATPVDNPDQRVSEDTRWFVHYSMTLGLGLMRSVVSLFSFVGLLWAISGDLTVPLPGGGSFTIPSYMLWVAILYAVAGTWITHLIGRPLIPINFQKEQVEANFRFSLVRFRENTEAVALYGGEDSEMKDFRLRFRDVIANFRALVVRNLKLSTFTNFYAQLSTIFPFVVASPRYFSGAIQLGDLMQISTAFDRVQGALSYFIDAYDTIAAWRAVIDRLEGFDNALIGANAIRSGVVTAAAADGALAASGIDLALPGGQPLQRGLDLRIEPGERVLVTGRSGSGKSTLFRTIAGLWPFARGRIALPPGRAMFLPQKPYMPLGTLRAALAYPEPDTPATDAELAEILTDLGLPRLADELHTVRAWSQELSGGELQRVAFARVLLKKPDWVFMDESTSALDTEAEALLYRLLSERLPNATVVSIGHRPSLEAMHDRKVVLEPA